jgi:uncharacterized protein (TIGR00369 family)
MTEPQSEDTPQARAGLARSPIHRFMRLQFLDPVPGADYVDVRLPFSDNLRRQDGEDILHGGVLATLIDVAGVWAIAALGGPPGPTVDMRIDFLRPALCEEHVARARVVRLGRNFAVTDVRVTDTKDRLIALGRGLFSTNPDHLPPHLRAK